MSESYLKEDLRAARERITALEAENERLQEAGRGVLPYLPDLDSAPSRTKVAHIEATRKLLAALGQKEGDHE